MKKLVLFILTFITHISFSQEKLDTIAISNDIDSIQTDSLENIGEIETTINYSATDSIFYDLKTQTLKLYGNSKIDYGNINLSAYEILIDWDEQTIDANFRVDSLGKKIGKPIFTEDNQSYETDKITYNFDSKKAKIKVNHRGLYLLAQHKESMPGLEEYLKVDPRKTVKLVSKKEIAAESTLFQNNKVFGGLYSSDEVRIEPRLAIPAVAKYLQSIGIDFLWKEEVLDFSHKQIITQKRKIDYKNLIMAPGNHLKGLGRDIFEKKEVQSSRLHMLRIMPKKKIKLPGGIMADLTLMRYPGYENLPSKKKLDKVIKKTSKAELDNGIHVIAVQGNDGSLTIGDSHHYTHDTHFPFENEKIDNLILKKFDQVLPIGKYDVIERWVGEYPAGKKDYLDHWIDKNICIANVTTGIGMSTGFSFAEDVINKLY